MYLKLEKKQLDKLRHVKWDESFSCVLGHYPDFFIAGPQRSGTTWLAKQLRRHPQVRMAWPKELYYFNRLAESGSEKSYHHDQIWKKISGSPREIPKSLAKIAYFDYLGRRGFNSRQLQWYLSFFSDSVTNRLIDLSARDFNLRKAGEKLVYGEATASYATLDESIIGDMVVLNEEMKVVLTFRHPIERAWSHARKDLPDDTRKAKEHGVITPRLGAFFQSDYQISCGDYSAILKKWDRVLKPGNLLSINYHQIDEDPRAVLHKIWIFLAVEESWMPQEDLLLSKINARKGASVPEVVHQFLAEILRSQILWFNQWAMV